MPRTWVRMSTNPLSTLLSCSALPHSNMRVHICYSSNNWCKWIPRLHSFSSEPRVRLSAGYSFYVIMTNLLPSQNHVNFFQRIQPLWIPVSSPRRSTAVPKKLPSAAGYFHTVLLNKTPRHIRIWSTGPAKRECRHTFGILFLFINLLQRNPTGQRARKFPGCQNVPSTQDR